MTQTLPLPFSIGPAEAGRLIFLAAGDKSLFEDAAAALAAMGTKSLFLGPVGAGNCAHRCWTDAN